VPRVPVKIVFDKPLPDPSRFGPGMSSAGDGLDAGLPLSGSR
jgi:hypothetical protein